MAELRQRVTDESRLGEGRVMKFRYRVEGIGREGFVLRWQGVLVAYENVCRHLPLPLDAGTGHFLAPDGPGLVCQMHGAEYEPLTGRCMRGPCAGASLKPLRVEVVDGSVWLLLPAGT
jgi:nitrite reductase/ring-hydroxylating ferredoxin subunit